MSNLAATAGATACVSEPTPTPVLEVIPGRLTDLGGLPIRRLLPRSQRRLVGAWCFLDSYGPLTFSSGKPMDVAPHPHIGLQTVSWLLDGEIVHHDSLGQEGMAGPGVLNLMTAGKGIAHAEETPPENVGRLRGVQLWVALPSARPHPRSRSTARSPLRSSTEEGRASFWERSRACVLRQPSSRPSSPPRSRRTELGD
jgi:quercetin 2,3-dioxygenase